MKCYRKGCKEPCDKFKMMYCLQKLNAVQAALISTLKNRCPECHERMVRAKVKKEPVMLCTNCGKVIIEGSRLYAASNM